MTDANQDWIDALERTHRAVRSFARSEFDARARKIMHRLQRTPASGIYGDDLDHKTLWDEFCYETHNGPTDDLRRAWHQVIDPHLNTTIESIPEETAILLSIYSCWELEGDLDLCGSVWTDGMKEMLEKALITYATTRRKG
jgi:hypothetical protein